MATEREKIIAAAQAHAVQLTRQAMQKKVKDSAVEDFMRRGFSVLDEDKPFDTYAAQSWASSQRLNAPHLFEPRERQDPGTSAAPGATREEKDYSKIENPVARMTAYREDQAQAHAGPQP